MNADLWLLVGLIVIALGLSIVIGLDAAREDEIERLTRGDWDTFTITTRDDGFSVPPDGEPHM